MCEAGLIISAVGVAAGIGNSAATRRRTKDTTRRAERRQAQIVKPATAQQAMPGASDSSNRRALPSSILGGTLSGGSPLGLTPTSGVGRKQLLGQ